MGLLMAGKEPEENLLLWKLFNEFDPGRKAYLNLQNIKEILRRPAVARVLGSCEPEKLMREMDLDGNGRVSFDEFRAAMLGRSGSMYEDLPQPRPLEKKGIFIGQNLQYYSDTFHSWIPVVVTKVDKNTCAIQIDVKPGYWLQGKELKSKICHPLKGVAL